MGQLVPFGEPWQTGANEATVVHLGFAARIAGVRVEPGTYSLYTVPHQKRWEVVLTRSVYHGGLPLDERGRSRDVGSGTVRAETTDRHVES